eukprot:Filipodium_phascolosomae@DN819_c0_g1_i1.p1
MSCSSCTSNSGTFFCNVCSCSWCPKCIAFSNCIQNKHHLTRLDTEISQSSATITTKSRLETPTKTSFLTFGSDYHSYDILKPWQCPHHPDQTALYFCLHCQDRCVCSDCVVFGRHKGHKVATAAEAVQIKSSKFQELLSNFNKERLRLQKNQETLTGVQQDVQENGRWIRRRLKAAHDEVVVDVDERSNFCFSGLDENVNSIFSPCTLR